MGLGEGAISSELQNLLSSFYQTWYDDVPECHAKKVWIAMSSSSWLKLGFKSLNKRKERKKDNCSVSYTELNLFTTKLGITMDHQESWSKLWTVFIAVFLSVSQRGVEFMVNGLSTLLVCYHQRLQQDQAAIFKLKVARFKSSKTIEVCLSGTIAHV